MAIRFNNVATAALVVALVLGLVAPGCKAFQSRDTNQPVAPVAQAQDPMADLNLTPAEKAAIAAFNASGDKEGARALIQAGIARSAASEAGIAAKDKPAADPVADTSTTPVVPADPVAPTTQVQDPLADLNLTPTQRAIYAALDAEGKRQFLMEMAKSPAATTPPVLPAATKVEITPTGTAPNLMITVASNGAASISINGDVQPTPTRDIPLLLAKTYRVNAGKGTGGPAVDWAAWGPNGEKHFAMTVNGVALTTTAPQEHAASAASWGSDYVFHVLEEAGKYYLVQGLAPADLARK